MPTVDFGRMEADATLEELLEAFAKVQKMLDYLMQGGLDSKNAREFGGWLVGLTELQSRDKTVGMSTEETAADDIRFWAGDVKTGNPTFKVTQAGILTAIGALIMSALGYPKITLDPTNNVLKIEQDATTSINFNPNYLGTTPVVNFHKGTFDGYLGYFSALNKFVMTTPSDSGVEVEISNGGLSGDVSLRPVGNVNVPSWNQVYSEGASRSLQTELNNKQNVISGFSGSFSTGTQTVFVSNGIITAVV